MIEVKRGDTRVIRVQTNMDLTGAVVKLLAAPEVGGAVELASSIEDSTAGIVSHKLTGALEVGEYGLELEIDRQGEHATAPTRGRLRLTVYPDLQPAAP